MPRRVRRPAGRDSQLATSLAILRDLIAEPWLVRELAAHHGVSWRQLYRDLGAFARAGVEIVVSREGRKVYRRASADSVVRALGLGRRR